jgi:hypothetical protein
MLTEPELSIDDKFAKRKQVDNHIKLIMASNEDMIVPISNNDRRFAVFDVSAKHQKDATYFDPLYAQMNSGGLAAMLHELLTMDLGDWHPRKNIPDTAARNEQKQGALRGFDAVLLDWLRSGLFPARVHGDGKISVTTIGVFNYLQEKYKREDITLHQIGLLFNDLEFGKLRRGGSRGYLVPRLADARAAWNEKRPPVTWDDTAEWQSMVDQGPRYEDDAPF